MAFLLMFCAGCGNKQAEKTIVEGKITLNGAPLYDVQVIFFPDPLKGSPGAARSVSLTDRQGLYHLKDDKGEDGIEAGTCRVCIVDPRYLPHRRALPSGGDDGKAAGQQKSRFSTAISDPLTTPFKDVEVKSGGPQTFDFEVGGTGKMK